MSKYGITVAGRLTEVCSIPNPLPSWAPDAEAFLEKMFPGKSGWQAVPDNAVNGTIDHGDGNFETPEITQRSSPVIFDSADWNEFAYAVLGEIALPESDDDDKKLLAGMDRYGAILQAARASTDNLVVAAVDQYDTEKYFRKDKVLRFLGVLNVNGDIVTDAELAAFNVQWPEV